MYEFASIETPWDYNQNEGTVWWSNVGFSCDDGIKHSDPVLHKPHRIHTTSWSKVARHVEYPVGMSSQAQSGLMKEEVRRILIHPANKNLEFQNEVRLGAPRFK